AEIAFVCQVDAAMFFDRASRVAAFRQTRQMQFRRGPLGDYAPRHDLDVGVLDSMTVKILVVTFEILADRRDRIRRKLPIRNRNPDFIALLVITHVSNPTEADELGRDGAA